MVERKVSKPSSGNKRARKKRRGLYKGPDSPLMTVAETMEFTGVCRHTLLRMEKGPNKRLTAVWIRGCKYYRRDEVYALVRIA